MKKNGVSGATGSVTSNEKCIYVAILRVGKLDFKLPPEIDAALAREAWHAHKPQSALLRRAVEAYLEELADARAVAVSRSQSGKPIPWAEVKRRYGVAV